MSERVGDLQELDSVLHALDNAIARAQSSIAGEHPSPREIHALRRVLGLLLSARDELDDVQDDRSAPR